MECGCVYSFVGGRSTTAETTAATAAHLGVTTYMFFLIFIPGTSLRVLYNNIHHHVAFARVRRKKNTEQDRPAVRSAVAAAAAAAAPEAAAAEASSTSTSSSRKAETAEDAGSTSDHLRIQQYVIFWFNF